MINWPHAILWGFCATIVLDTLLASSRALGLTRMDLPFMLGTMFTVRRERAKVLGFLFHLINGWIFALLYIAIFVSLGIQTWWVGALIGLTHALFILIPGMALLPSIHPRMATEDSGPDATHQLEPPGFLALHYGKRTPLATIFAHIIFGMILGVFYR